MEQVYDVIIIGSGPSGMSAALYTSRANLKTLIIEKEYPGGKMIKAKSIDNYLGASSTDPTTLASDMFAQSIKYGAKYKQGNVVSISDSTIKAITLSNGETFNAKSIILAIGGTMSKSNFKYDKYLNKGLSYCVVCDANFYKDKAVAIIGNDETIDDAKYLSNIVSKVYFLNKGKNTIENEKVETILLNNEDYTILGEDSIESIEVNGKSIKVDGVFYVDDSNSFNGLTNLLEIENGYICVDSNMRTNLDGIFACGDITNNKVKQVSSAVGEGAVAALEAIKYVNTNFK